MKAVVRFLARALQIGGALALVYAAIVFARAQGFQTYEQWLFNRSLMNDQLANDQLADVPSSERATLNSLNSGASDLPTPKIPAPKIGSVIGRIEIPSLNLSTMILEGDGERQLRLGAGHLPGTVLPGERGNVVIAAHRDTFFRPLRKISRNDEITLTTLSGSFRYVVESVEITNPQNTAILQASAKPELSLVTCYPFYLVGSAPDRFIVHARMAE